MEKNKLSKQKLKQHFPTLITWIIICLTTGSLGSIATSSSISNWYINLNKPSFNPPNWIFGPVWTSLYILMGISAYLIWKQGFNKPKIRKAVIVFCFQLILNLFWSLIFFGLQSPGLAFIEILFLWLAILYTIKLFREISKPATYLLIPYLFWVTFASILNLNIYLLN